MSPNNLADTFGASARDLVRPGQRPGQQSQRSASEAEGTDERRDADPPAPPPDPVAPPDKPVALADPAAEPDWHEQEPTPATSQSIVYLAPRLRDTLDAARKRDRRTNADLVFDAIDRAQHQLPALVTRQQRQERPPNSLFSARPSRSRQRATSPSERTVPFTFRATADELAVIDRLVEETSASSRSALIAAALHATFNRGRRKR